MTTQTTTGEQETQRCPIRSDYLPLSPSALNDPEGAIRPMRNETPVFFCEQTQMWIITRYDDLVAAHKDTKRFTSTNQFRSHPIPEETKSLFPEDWTATFGLITDDPPVHTRIRKLCNKAFTRPRIAAMRPGVEARTKSLLDELVPRGQGDLIPEFSALLPAAIFADILGIPNSDAGRVLVWGDAFMLVSETMVVPEEDEPMYFREIRAFEDLVAELAKERRANPLGESDFMSNLVTSSESDEPPLTDEELLGVMCVFIVAGHETTRHLIGNTIDLLLKHPEQLEELRANPELIHNVIEESLRHSGSTKGMFRRTTEDVEIGGATIPAGDFVQLMYSSANHDEAVFEDHERFDIHRKDVKKHIAFGIGAHFCIGAPLARLTAEVAIPEILRRMPNLRYKDGTAPIERIPSLPVNGLKRLELEWDA